MTYFVYLASLFIFMVSAVHGFTINGQDLSKVASKGQFISYKPDATANNIALSCDGSSLTLGTVESLSVDDVCRISQGLDATRSRGEISGGVIESKVYSMEIATSACFYHSVNIGTKKITINAGTSIDAVLSIFSSPSIVLTSPQINLDRCFIRGCEYLYLKSNSLNSIFSMIRFKIGENSQIPCMVKGELNLKTGKTSKAFFVTGAKEVEILFSNSAFDA